MAKALAQFTITRTGEGEYALHLEDEDGETTEFTADSEMIEDIMDTIEEQLEAEEEDLLADEDEDEESEEDD